MEILRRTFVLSSLALAALPLAQAHDGTRKSLSFKQPLPHAEFTTTPPRLSAHVQHDAHPHDIARLFIEEHLIAPGTTFYIRNDSYTDQNTGISHVYARQTVHNIEVEDGDVNLNIRDGQFARRINTPTSVGWSQENYCAERPGRSNHFACEISLNRINTAAAMYPTRVYSATEDYNPIAAAYFFSLAAYPDILPSNIQMDSVIATRKPCDDPMIRTECWSVSSLPGSLAPVQARLVYVQTHNKHGESQLDLAWRLEVTMQDNQYEAYVSALDPSKIIAVADWVKDAPVPNAEGWLTALEEKVFGQSVFSPQEAVRIISSIFSSSSPPSSEAAAASPGGTYRVWKWGVNDPASGNRTLEESPYDKTASPLGWHSVPARNDPVNSHPGMNANAIVIAQANWAGGRDWKLNPRPDGGSDLVFDFPYGANPWDQGWETREPRTYVNASVTQLFYLANTYHDLLYLYGFDEVSGNFQQYNFGKGGGEGDGVILDAQD
ncbi:Fungalysin/Thermolysin Extracellular metalloproteinase 5, partial [Ceratobasidium sp. 392]